MKITSVWLGIAMTLTLAACGGESVVTSNPSTGGSTVSSASTGTTSSSSSTSGSTNSSGSPAATGSTTTSGATTSSGSTTSSGTGSSSGSSSSTANTLSATPLSQLAAARLLMQGTFGATLDTINATTGQTYAQWFSAQAAATPSYYLPTALANPSSQDWSPTWFNTVVQAPDQLRQRMAFALSEILVVSTNGGPLIYNDNPTVTYYYDILVRNALGNFQTLLQQVTLSPAMGLFLSTWRNSAGNASLGTHADQNYGREVMQLFTVGLWQLNIDGTQVTDGNGNPVPTYSQNDVAQLSNVFTGWASAPTAHTGDAAYQNDDDETDPMVAYPDYHDKTQKTIIGGVVIPAGGTSQSDLSTALSTLFNHPNVGPFIGKQLIERLVTSNPSPGYVQRVAQVFNNDGTGVRGNLLAVAQAILTDPEATSVGGNTYGKLRDPLIRLTNLWRTFNGSNSSNEQDEYLILQNGNVEFGEYPLASPSVFNFYRPDYQPPGAMTQGDLVGPEFQITNEATLVETANQLQNEAYQFIDSSGTVHAGADYSRVNNLDPNAVMLHTAEWEQYASNPQTLVAQLNLVLMAGQMPVAMQSTLANYITGIPVASAGNRVAEAAELVINSPQYAIQR